MAGKLIIFSAPSDQANLAHQFSAEAEPEPTFLHLGYQPGSMGRKKGRSGDIMFCLRRMNSAPV